MLKYISTLAILDFTVPVTLKFRKIDVTTTNRLHIEQNVYTLPKLLQ